MLRPYSSVNDGTMPPHSSYCRENELGAAIGLCQMLMTICNDSETPEAIERGDDRHKRITAYKAARPSHYLPPYDAQLCNLLLRWTRSEDEQTLEASQLIAGEWAIVLGKRFPEIRNEFGLEGPMQEVGGPEELARLRQRITRLEKLASKSNTVRDRIREQRNAFSRPRRLNGQTWSQIFTAYRRKYPDDEKASPDTLRLSLNRCQDGK